MPGGETEHHRHWRESYAATNTRLVNTHTRRDTAAAAAQHINNRIEFLGMRTPLPLSQPWQQAPAWR
jgi:hypothetical protein